MPFRGHAITPVEETEHVQLQNEQLPSKATLHSNPTEAKVPALKKRNKCSCIRGLMRFGLIFGLDFSYDPTRSFLKCIVFFLICFIVWFWPWVALKFVAEKNMVCYEKRKSFFKPYQCGNSYYLIQNVNDAALGIVSSICLLYYRGNIARLFAEILNVFDENDDDEGEDEKTAKATRSAKSKSSAFSLFLLLFCIFIPPVAVAAKVAPLSPMLIFVKNVPLEMIYVACNLPLLVLSTYFCFIYAFACFVIRQHLLLLANRGPNLKYPEFFFQYHRCQAMVNLVEASFSQALPFIYSFKAVRLVTWMMYFLSDESPSSIYNLQFLSQVPMLSVHLLQTLMLFGLPIMINVLVDMPISGPVTPATRKHPIGVYTVECLETKKRLKDLLHGHHCYLTAGGLRISTWFIPLLFLILYIVTAMDNYKNSVMEEINNYIKAGIRSIPRPPKPTPCPSHSCPQCPSLTCNSDELSGTTDS